MMYFGEHSLRFYFSEDYVGLFAYDGDTANPDTWNRWHLVPAKKPVFQPPEEEIEWTKIFGRQGMVNLSKYVFSQSVYNNCTGSLEFVMDPDYFDQWVDIYADVKRYFHGRDLVFVERNDRYFYRKGHFTVSSWEPDETIDTITLEYSLEPFRYERWDGFTPWLWDDFDFSQGFIRSGENYRFRLAGYGDSHAVRITPGDKKEPLHIGAERSYRNKSHAITMHYNPVTSDPVDVSIPVDAEENIVELTGLNPDRDYYIPVSFTNNLEYPVDVFVSEVNTAGSVMTPTDVRVPARGTIAGRSLSTDCGSRVIVSVYPSWETAALYISCGSEDDPMVLLDTDCTIDGERRWLPIGEGSEFDTVIDNAGGYTYLPVAFEDKSLGTVPKAEMWYELSNGSYKLTPDLGIAMLNANLPVQTPTNGKNLFKWNGEEGYNTPDDPPPYSRGTFVPVNSSEEPVTESGTIYYVKKNYYRLSYDGVGVGSDYRELPKEGDNISGMDLYERTGTPPNYIYTLTEDEIMQSGKVYCRRIDRKDGSTVYKALPSPGESTAGKHLFEYVNESGAYVYKPTEDVTVDAAKNYYEQHGAWTIRAANPTDQKTGVIFFVTDADGETHVEGYVLYKQESESDFIDILVPANARDVSYRFGNVIDIDGGTYVLYGDTKSMETSFYPAKTAGDLDKEAMIISYSVTPLTIRCKYRGARL